MENNAPDTMAPSSGPRDISEFCRSCKASLAKEKEIQVVSEWCCACVNKLLKDHHHRCEFNFATEKNQCLHCRECNYSNSGKNPKPCVGAPSDAQDAAAKLVEKAQILCAAEYEVAELKDKASRAFNKTEYKAKIVYGETKISSAKKDFQVAAREWKDHLNQYENQVPKISRKRREEDEAAGKRDSEIFEKKPAVDTAGKQPVGGHQQDDKMESARRLLEALVKADEAIDEAKELVRQSICRHEGIILTGPVGGQIANRLPAVAEEAGSLVSLVLKLNEKLPPPV